jgi:hypothetical protein
MNYKNGMGVLIVSCVGFASPTILASTDCSKIQIDATEVAKDRSSTALAALALNAADKAYAPSPTPHENVDSHDIASSLASAFANTPQLTDDLLGSNLVAGLNASCEAIKAGDTLDGAKAKAFTKAGLNQIKQVDDAQRIAAEKAKYPSSPEEFGKGDKLILHAHAPIFKPTPYSQGCANILIGVPDGDPRCIAPLGSELRIDSMPGANGLARVRFICVPGLDSVVSGREEASAKKLLQDIAKQNKNITEHDLSNLKAQIITLDSRHVGGIRQLSVCKPDTSTLYDSTTIGSLKANYPHVKGLVEVGPEYEVDINELAGYGRHQFGWAYGALVIPYKFHGSDNSFSSNVTVAGFAGYSFSLEGFQLTPVVTGGLSTVQVPKTDSNGVTTNDNKSAASAAWGLVFTFSRTRMFQVGLLSGWDWAGNSSGYQYNGKPWIALSVGVDLTK